MERQRVKAAVKRTTGRAKAAAGRTVGDPKLEIDGRVEQGEGLARSAIAVAREFVDDKSAENVVRQTGKAISDASGRLYGTARGQIDEVGAALRAQSTEYAGAVSERVRSRPLAALLVAGAIGYTLAVVTRRR